MEGVNNKAKIVLALSRHTRSPQRKGVGWDGPRTMYVDKAATDKR